MSVTGSGAVLTATSGGVWSPATEPCIGISVVIPARSPHVDNQLSVLKRSYRCHKGIIEMTWQEQDRQLGAVIQSSMTADLLRQCSHETSVFVAQQVATQRT